ncbi:hypothetical protein ACRE_044740 [Hapsidospora chrysogenum ATCC 11550]|uniref:Uncharacterized protein n=1 Tax=Hapsidospora chrysogenum (strain ATCC 11550 / CBS 779.69 / DSM 880 / IAM 14645 / JCM 23072 / IMI 49137) TaxID=857340 RepID=A0A086T5Y3_HAPC1|nr:hypothetical protein ACRE_044740 [Hapsidospora chrysogenum ATCC 11550]
MAKSSHCNVSSPFHLPVFTTILFFLVSGGLADPLSPSSPTDDNEAGHQHLCVVNVVKNLQFPVARARVRTEGTAPTLEATIKRPEQWVEEMIEAGPEAPETVKVFVSPNRPQETRPAEETVDRSEL